MLLPKVSVTKSEQGLEALAWEGVKEVGQFSAQRALVWLMFGCCLECWFEC